MQNNLLLKQLLIIHVFIYVLCFRPNALGVFQNENVEMNLELKMKRWIGRWNDIAGLHHDLHSEY